MCPVPAARNILVLDLSLNNKIITTNWPLNGNLKKPFNTVYNVRSAILKTCNQKSIMRVPENKGNA